ncbi:MAG: DUF1600 domain-containing protein [Metamycoplasmataceae bacterium]
MNYKQISKITIYSIVMCLFALFGIIMFSIELPNWIKYDSSFLTDPTNFIDPSIELMPVSVQASRLWQVMSLIICILMIILNSWEIKKMEQTNYKKYYISSLGIFTWLLLPYTIYIGVKEGLYSKFLNYNSQDRNEKLQMSFNAFRSGISKNGYRDKLFWNTFFGYFVFLITLVGFVTCFILSENIFKIEELYPISEEELKPGFTISDYYNNLKTDSIFIIYSTFTRLTNISCFIFMLSFVLFNKKNPFRNNSIMIAISSYIFVVLVIFWGYLFPQSLANNDYIFDFQWFQTIWTHAVTPILIIAFSITSILISKSAPTTFKGFTLNAIIYPLFYGIYIYSIPFYTRFSVYGGLTNMNPNMDSSVGIEGISKTGNYLMIFAFIGLAFVFIFVFFCFWSLAFIVNKKSRNSNKVI